MYNPGIFKKNFGYPEFSGSKQITKIDIHFKRSGSRILRIFWIPAAYPGVILLDNFINIFLCLTRCNANQLKLGEVTVLLEDTESLFLIRGIVPAQVRV